MTPSASPRVTAYAGPRRGLPLRRARAAAARAGRARAAPFALPLALGLGSRAPPEIRVLARRSSARPRSSTTSSSVELDGLLGAAGRAARARARRRRTGSRSSPARARSRSGSAGRTNGRSTLRLRCARWGNYEIGDIRLRARDRLGLLDLGDAARPASSGCASTRSRRRCARIVAPVSTQLVHRQPGRAAEGRGARVRRPARSSPPATASARSTGGRAPAATSSSSTSAIRSGTPT